MKRILTLISAFLVLLTTGCAVNSIGLQKIVQSKISETKKDNASNLNIEIQINKNIELRNECKQEKSSYIPALLYWGWNSEVKGEFSKETITNEIEKVAKSKIEALGLNKALKNNKLVINIDELPTKFKFQEKGDVAILIFAYIVSMKKYIAPEKMNFKGNYKVINEEGKVVLEKDFMQENKLATESNPNKTAKKLASKFIGSYNNELDRFISILLAEVKAHLETTTITQQ
ncbi:hypothetical protein NF867_03190 [Solitalea sp. MAHUQ-68]|uniref:Uncharacterized protein n=1 Tax=Solitalea agri TaxID=2953739 RepID=A0A9X2JBV4_9SPHI|nr:hypothetical protein [Solitalea agri]MCO4291864.1 hypothetical protein [Solitalea agri]